MKKPAWQVTIIDLSSENNFYWHEALGRWGSAYVYHLFIYQVCGCELENQPLPALTSRNPLLCPIQQKKHNENIQLCSSRLFLATEALSEETQAHLYTTLCLQKCMDFFFFFCLSAAEVVQHATYDLIKTPLYRTQSQQFCAPASWQGIITNCLTFIIDTVFNELMSVSPVLVMVTSVENEPGLCVFQSARPCPGQRCGQTSVHRKWWLVCLS